MPHCSRASTPLPATRWPFRRQLAWAALPVILGIGLASCNDKQAAQPASAPGSARPEVSVVTLHPQSVAITAELPGFTTASLVAEVRPQVSGIIQKRLYAEGGEVKAGDPLYQLDPSSYQASYDSAAAALQKAEAAVPSAQTKVERYKDLIKQNAVSKQDVDDANATLLQAQADVASAQASLEMARINLAYTKITAPIGGRTDKSSLTEGALVTADQTTLLTTIRTLDPINVDVTQSSTNLLNLRQAVQEGRIRFNGKDVSVKLKLDNGTMYSLPGTLAFAEANVSESTGTFTVRAVFPNPDHLLLPGFYVRAVVEEGVAENSFLVPQRAVSHNPKGDATALFINRDNKVEERILGIGRNVGNNWLVTSGVGDGDRILVEGSQFARAGQDVIPQEVTIDETTGEVKGTKQSSLPASTSKLAARD